MDPAVVWGAWFLLFSTGWWFQTSLCECWCNHDGVGTGAFSSAA